MSIRCESCDFPAGPRTGRIHIWRQGDVTVALCDDCVRAVRDFHPEFDWTDAVDMGEVQ